MADTFVPLNPLKWCCKLFSVWPYSGCYSLKSADLYYRLLTFSASVYTSSHFFKIKFKNQATMTKIVYFSHLTNVFIFTSQLVVNLIMGFLNKQPMANVIRGLIVIDQQLSEIGSQPDNKNTYLFQCVIIAACVFAHIIHWAIISFFSHFKYENIIFCFSIIQNMFISVMIAGLAHVIKCRYRTINSQLCNLLLALPTTPSSMILQRLKRLSSIHRNLCEIVHEINFSFSLEIFLFLGHTVSNCAFSILTILKAINSGQVINLDNMKWSIYVVKYLLFTMLMTEQCHAAALEVSL